MFSGVNSRVTSHFQMLILLRRRTFIQRHPIFSSLSFSTSVQSVSKDKDSVTVDRELFDQQEVSESGLETVGQEEDYDPSLSRPAKLIRKKLGSFVDYKRLKIVAGNGGNGGISFRRLYKEPMGPPNGGNGGRGGDVMLRVSKEVSSLNGVSNYYKAGDGQAGRGKDLNGAKGKPLEFLVPVGTTVRYIADLDDMGNVVDSVSVDPFFDKRKGIEGLRKSLMGTLNDKGKVDQEKMASEWEVNTGKYNHEINHGSIDQETADQSFKERLFSRITQHYILKTKTSPMMDRLLLLSDRIPAPTPRQSTVTFDLMTDQETVLLAKGGRGGLGNTHFQSPDIRGPLFALKGEVGQGYLVELELKTLADAGLVGFPNAGKSTFLQAVSRAHPKIASYPFTTLNPYIGTIEYPDRYTLTLADIPGLVPGAHMNIGLGFAFLRHIERSKILVYVVDLGSLNALDDFHALQYELESYQKGLTQRRSMVVANKADLGDVAKANLEKLVSNIQMPVIPISAREGKNVYQATATMRRLLEDPK